MAQTQEKREYAIPELEKLPIHDREHILMAANAINSIKGVTDEQRINGRIAIAVAADRFGLNVKSAKRTHLHFEGMALDMPSLPNHPNRLPFSGVMTRLDVPSNFPVGGTANKMVVIPTAVAEKALPTLLGMAIDYKPNFDGHDRKSKLGIITEAYIGEIDKVLGTPLHIAGFFYAADFPQEVSKIQADRESLGFSYEAEAFVEDMNGDPWVCSNCEFTGAAVLYRDKAAFTSTSIQASKHEGVTAMSPEEIAAMQKKNQELEAANAKLEAEQKALLEAASVQHLVKTHADALRTCAANMAAAGIGTDSKNGHVALLHNMADKLEASAIMGKIPNTFDSYFYGEAEKTGLSASIASAVKDANKTFEDRVSSLSTKLSDAEGKLAALQAGSTKTDETTRKSLSAGAIATLKKLGINEEQSQILSVAQVDQACQKAGLTSQDSMALKLNLRASGVLV